MTPLALLMHRTIERVTPQTSLREAATRMRDCQIGALLVGEVQSPVGILSEADIVRKAAAFGLDMEQTSVSQIMSRPVLAIDLEKTAWEANNLMATHGVRHLLVTDAGNVVGILSVRDLLICFKNRI